MVIPIELLTDRGADREQWLKLWTECGREPFAHPDYVALFAADGSEARCVVSRATKGIVLLPIILRPIPEASPASIARLMDATSPYGYGGPYMCGEVPLDGFLSAMTVWMKANRIVSMFGRLALDVPQPGPLPDGISVKSSSENVVVDLGRPAAEQWFHYEHKVRKNIKKALRGNLSVEVKTAFTDLEEFSQLYESTMDRRDADSWYYFGTEFFSTLTERLDGSYVAAEVRDESGRLVSGELVLRSDRNYYSFLGGTLREAFPLAPNDLLKHAVIEHGRDSGRAGFVLGGGYSAGDGIFRYKRSFDPTGVIPFRRLEIVADRLAYNRLVATRVAEGRSRLRSARLDPGYFPGYRSQFVVGEGDDVGGV